MKKFIGITLVMVVMAGAAIAATNPWENDGDRLNVTIQVDPITEVWSTLGSGQARSSTLAPVLAITNAGGIVPANGKVADTVSVNSNINTSIFVQVAAATDIPTGTRFHVIIAPTNRATYNCVGNPWPNGAVVGGVTVENVVASNLITWDRRSTGYVGNLTGAPVLAFTGTAGISSVATLVDYAADSIHEMPATGQTDSPTVIWTIAPTL